MRAGIDAVNASRSSMATATIETFPAGRFDAVAAYGGEVIRASSGPPEPLLWNSTALIVPSLSLAVACIVIGDPSANRAPSLGATRATLGNWFGGRTVNAAGREIDAR